MGDFYTSLDVRCSPLTFLGASDTPTWFFGGVRTPTTPTVADVKYLRHTRAHTDAGARTMMSLGQNSWARTMMSLSQNSLEWRHRKQCRTKTTNPTANNKPQQNSKSRIMSYKFPEAKQQAHHSYNVLCSQRPTYESTLWNQLLVY